MTKYILFIILSLIVWQVTAQNPCIKTEWYTTLSGTVGEDPIRISVIAVDEINVIGSYCEPSNSGKITLRGTYSLKHLHLTTETDSAHRIFELQTLTKDGYIDAYEGVYTDATTNDEKSVALAYSSGSWGLPDDRYPDFPGDDEVLETFAQNVIDAVITKDVAFLSTKMCFPATVYLSNKKKIILRDEKDFRKHATRILSQELIEKAKNWQRCNFSSNHSGVMLGKGEIWLWRSDAATQENPMYCIKDIVSQE